MDGYLPIEPSAGLSVSPTHSLHPAPRRLRSQYHSTCAACHGHIKPGQWITWLPGDRPEHAICPLDGPSTNDQPTPCERCGLMLAPGQGLRYACAPGHDHHGFRPELRTSPDQHLDCRDSERCRSRRNGPPLANRQSPEPAKNDA
jgi:hypothetical protein